MIQVEGLCAEYPGSGEGHVLENVTFSAEAGEKIALIGANGAGKSTLLLSLVGVIPLHAGSITIGGIPLEPKNLAAARRKTGLVFQNPDDQLFMPTLWEDVLFGPRNYARLEAKSGRLEAKSGRLEAKSAPRKRADRADAALFAEIEAKCERHLEALGIAALKNRISHKLSGGEKRLGALACVLVMEPDVLLLDEPTAFLDPRSRRVLMGVLSALPQTMLIATHDLDFAAKLCKRVILLAGKRVRAAGPAEDTLSNQALLEECGL